MRGRHTGAPSFFKEQPGDADERILQSVLRLQLHGGTLLGSPRSISPERADLRRRRGPRAHLGARAGASASTPGQEIPPDPLPDDRVYRSLSRDSDPDRDPPHLRRSPVPRIHPQRNSYPAVARKARSLLVRSNGPDARLWRHHGRGLPGRNRRRARRSDGGGALTRHEPLAGDAKRRRPPGGDPHSGTDAERIDLPPEG